MTTVCNQCGFGSWPGAVNCQRCGALLSVKTPGVWKWFVVYCVMMALVYLGLMGFGVIALVGDPADLEMKADEARIMGIVFIILGLVFAVPFALGPFLPKQGWAWVFGIVLICIGLTSACCLPASIALLIFWLKPETKAFFGKYSVAPPPPPMPGTY